MKNSVKETAANAAISTVRAVAAPLHISVQFGTNVLTVVGNKIADGIAYAEGYSVEKLNGTPREETIGLRVDYTNMKMMQAAVKADQIRQRLQDRKDKAKVQIKDASTKLAAQFKKQEDSLDVADMVAEFNVQTLRANRDKVLADDTLDTPTKNKLINTINQAIGKLNRGISPATVHEAFNVTLAV